jgi:hypothetical protein
MPAAKEKGKQRAALGELNGKREIEWQGLTLSLAPKLPGSVLRAFGDLEGGKSIGPLNRIMQLALGADQFEEVWEKVDELELSIEDAMGVLMDESDDESLIPLIMATYGLSVGESSASQGS